MEQNKVCKKYMGGGRMERHHWIQLFTLILVCFCVTLYKPMGIQAEVGTVVETWEWEALNEDPNTKQDQPTGIIQYEFSKYQGTDAEVLPEGLALKLTIPKGDYTIPPSSLEAISNKALDKNKKIYSMTIVGEEGAQILSLDETERFFRQYLNNRGLASQGKETAFALIEVDFQVPIVSMEELFAYNDTLKYVKNLKISERTTSMKNAFANTSALISIPEPFIIPENVKDISFLFYNTGMKTVNNLRIEGATNVRYLLETKKWYTDHEPEKEDQIQGVEHIKDWYVCTESADSIFSIAQKLKSVENVHIKCSDAPYLFRYNHPSERLIVERIKNLTIEAYKSTETQNSFSFKEAFTYLKNLRELDVKFIPFQGLESLDLTRAFDYAGAELTSFQIPDGIKQLNMAAMLAHSKITAVPTGFSIPDSVEKLNAQMSFFDCQELESIPNGFQIPDKEMETWEVTLMFAMCPKLKTLPENFTVPISTDGTYIVSGSDGIFYGCNNLTSLPNGFHIRNLKTENDFEAYKQKRGRYDPSWYYSSIGTPLFKWCDYTGNHNDFEPEYTERVELPRMALPLKVDDSLKLYQKIGDVNFTQKLFFAGLPSDMQEQEMVFDVGDAYLDSKYDLQTKLETIKNNLELKGYTDISFILKPYEVLNPIAENYAKFRSLSTRDVGSLDSGKTFDDFITELGSQMMDCDPKVIEVKYSGGVVASTPELTVTPVYTGTDTPFVQTEWTKDNITVNIVAKDDVNGIDKIIITDPNGTITDVPNTDPINGNEFTYGHQIPVTDMTTSGEYTYTYQTVNKQGSSSDEISVTIRVDVDKPQASIENGILTAGDQHSGVKEIKLPNGTVISWTDDYGNNGYEVSEYGTYEIYDYAGNVTEVIYKAMTVTEPAITLVYEKEWTNKDVVVEVTITNADEVALLEFPDGKTQVLGDENTVTTSYLVTEEGEKDYHFAITKKTREEGSLTKIAHIKLDKTAPTSSIVTVNGKNYLKASDTLSGVSHLISPSGKTIMWLPEYEQNGYQIAEDGTYQVYDRAGNNGEQYGTQIKEEVTPIAPIPTIPSFPEENKTEPETDKKTEDKKEPETDKKTEDKTEPETDKKTEDKKESKPDKKAEDKKESKPDKKTEDKTADKQSKEDGTLEYSKTPETPTDVEIKLLTPDGKIETIYIPKEKVYLLESGETIFGRDIGYPFIDRIYYGGKGRPIIVGLNGEEYQCLKIAPVSELVMSDSKHGTLVGTSNVTSPKTGDNIIQVSILFVFSGVFVAGVSIRNHRKTMK